MTARILAGVQTPARASALPPRRSRRLIGSALLVGAALLLGGCAAAAPAAPPTATGAAVDSSAVPTPSSTPEAGATTEAPAIPRMDASLGALAVAPTVPPTRVQVPSLEIDVSVTGEGIDADGALALPADPDVASWYRWGPSPWSAEGATVIASHVDSLEYGIGQFARLASAPVGTTVSVTADDGRVAEFAVQQVDVLDKTQIDWNTVFDRSGAPRLILITCGGEFDYDTGHYLSNVVVIATPLT